MGVRQFLKKSSWEKKFAFKYRWLKLRLKLGLATNGQWVRLQDGLWWGYYTDKTWMNHIWLGTFDTREVGFMERYLTLFPGTFLDIGANFGIYALKAAKVLGNKAVIHAFEPVDVVFERLERNVKKNGFQTIKLHPIALSDKRGSATIFVNPDQLGVNTLEAEVGKNFAKGQKKVIVTDTLDEYLPEHGIRGITLAKLDVEGHEASVIAGGARTLAEERFPIMMEDFEVRKVAFATLAANPSQPIGMLVQRGFVFYQFRDGGCAHLVPPNSGKLTDYNLLAVPSELQAKLRDAGLLVD